MLYICHLCRIYTYIQLSCTNVTCALYTHIIHGLQVLYNIPVYSKLYIALVPLLLLLGLYTNICNYKWFIRIYSCHMYIPTHIYPMDAHTHVFHKPLHVRTHFTDWTQILCANDYALFFWYIFIITCYIYFAYNCPINAFTCSIVIHADTCIMTADSTH